MQSASTGSHHTLSAGRAVILLLGALTVGWAVTKWLDRSGSEGFAGVLRAHSTQITSPAEGRVQEILATAGTDLQPGEPIVLVIDEDLDRRLAAKHARIAALEAELRQVRAQADIDLAWRSRVLDSEIFQTRLRATSILQERLNKQVEDLAWRDVLQNGTELVSAVARPEFLTPLTFDGSRSGEIRMQAMLRQDAAQSAAETLSAQLELCEERLQGLEELRGGLAAKVSSAVGLASLEDELKQARGELELLQMQKQELTIPSPVYGTVGLFYKRAGQSLTAGDLIVEVFDRQRQFLSVSLPSSSVLRLKAGTILELEFSCGTTRKGTVAEISPQASSPASERPEEACVLVRIEPTGKLWPNVPLGSQVQVLIDRD